MRAILNIPVKWPLPYGLKPKKQFLHFKVRKFSKKITFPPEQAQEKKNKLSNYLYTIPPWMKKETVEKSKEAVENKQLAGENKQLIKKSASDKLISNKDHQTSTYMMLQAKKDNANNKELISNKLSTNKDHQTSNYMMLQPKKNNAKNKEIIINKLTTNKDHQTSNYMKLQKNNTRNKEVSNNKLIPNKYHNTNKLQGKQDNANREVSKTINALKNNPTIKEDSGSSVLLRNNKLQTFINKIHTNVPNKEKQQSNITKKDSNKNQNKINERKNKNNSLVQSKFRTSNENRNNFKTYKTLSTNSVPQKAFPFMNLPKLNQEQREPNKNQINKILEISNIASANLQGKVQTEHNKPKNMNTAVKVSVKSIELIEESEHLKTIKKGNISLKEISKQSKLSKTKSDDFNELNDIKANDILSQETLEAKEKITMKNTESENLFLNKSNKKEVSSNKNEKKETNLINEVLNVSSNDQDIGIVGNKINLKENKKKTAIDKRDLAIVKLTSNPLKLNSNESLFAYKKNKNQLKGTINKNDELKTKNEMTERKNAIMKIKMQTMKRRPNNNYQRLSANMKNENSVNTNILKQKYNLDATIKKKTNKTHINDLSAQKTFQFLQKKDMNSKPKQKSLILNKSKVLHTSVIKQRESKNIAANSIRRTNDTNLERLNTSAIKKMIDNSQNEWVKSIKNITPKPSSLKSKPSNISNKKPIFVSKMPVPKVNKIKFNLKNSNLNLKKFRPVFGPPSCGPPQNNQNSSGGNSNNNNDNGDNKNCIIDTNTCCIEDTKTNQENSFNKDNYIKDQCADSNKNKEQLLTKLFTFLNNFKELIMNYFPILDTLQRGLKHYLTKTGNRPIDNLNISLLRTQDEKQPIYICDKCSYLFKCPTIYQKLHQKLLTFSHLIKNKEELKPKDINTITGIPLIKCETAARDCSSNLKTSCIKKKKKLDTLGVTITTTCPKKSYSEVLSNLFAKHLQQKSK